MGDDSKTFDLEVRTRYSGEGMEEARADALKTNETLAGAGAGGGKVDYAKLAAERAAAEKAMAAAGAETLATETAKTIEQEKQVVVATQRAMMEASIAGDKTELAKLQAELAVRQLTIKTLQTQAMTQAEINALLVEQDALITESAAAAAAQVAAQAASAESLGYREVRAAAHAYHGLERAMEGGTMSARTLTMSLRGLYELLIANPWVAVATAIGAVALAFGMWVKKSAEAREKLAEDIDKIIEKNAELEAETAKEAEKSHFEALKADLAKVKSDYEAAIRVATEFFAIEREKGDIELATKRAELESEEQKKLKEANGDPVKEAEIKHAYALQLLEATQKNDQHKADLTLKEAQEKQAAAEKAIAGDQQKIEAAQKPSEAVGEYQESLDELHAAQKILKGDSESKGVQSAEEKSLSRLKRLRGKQREGELWRPDEKMELSKLERKEGDLRKKAKEAPTYDDKELIYTVEGGKGAREAVKTLEQKPLSERNAKEGYELDLARKGVKMAEAAEKALELSKKLPEQKKAADEAQNKQKEQLEAAKSQQVEHYEDLRRAKDRVEVETKRRKSVPVIQKTATEKTDAHGQDAIQKAQERAAEEAGREAERKKKEADARAKEEAAKAKKEAPAIANEAGILAEIDRMAHAPAYGTSGPVLAKMKEVLDNVKASKDPLAHENTEKLLAVVEEIGREFFGDKKKTAELAGRIETLATQVKSLRTP